MKQLFDELSAFCSRKTTESYSTSFSWAVKTLPQDLRQPIYDIYGFVRVADEIVDSFLDYDRKTLMKEFRTDTFKALERGISPNPILNSFQRVVYEFSIDHDCIDTFLKSMEMDLDKTHYDKSMYDTYILGSAEVVGLMCLSVFVKGDQKMYQKLKPGAMKLGSAFQKINFLRDIKEDTEALGRSYFPLIQEEGWNPSVKLKIEAEIEEEFLEAKRSILELPNGTAPAVLLAYNYYYKLFKKIKKAECESLMKKRIRIPNRIKGLILVKQFIRFKTA